MISNKFMNNFYLFLMKQKKLSSFFCQLLFIKKYNLFKYNLNKKIYILNNIYFL